MIIFSFLKFSIKKFNKKAILGFISQVGRFA